MRNFCPRKKCGSALLPISCTSWSDNFRVQHFSSSIRGSALTNLFGRRSPFPNHSQGFVQRSRRTSYVAFRVLALSFVLAVTTACNRQQTQISRHLDFNQDVQPILASRCFSCHGPDPEMRKAGLRLDLAEWAMKKREGHRDAIVPGHPEKSELVRRIESNDPHYLMPQNAQGEAKPMSGGEIAILREWIKQGAVYRPHWAFEAPVRLFLATREATPGPRTQSTTSSSRNSTNTAFSLPPRRTSRHSFDGSRWISPASCQRPKRFNPSLATLPLMHTNI